MEQRYDAVLGVIRDEFTVSKVAKKFGVSRQSVHTWLQRYEAGIAKKHEGRFRYFRENLGSPAIMGYNGRLIDQPKAKSLISSTFPNGSQGAALESALLS